jgi:hypothetical protein
MRSERGAAIEATMVAEKLPRVESWVGVTLASHDWVE